VPRRSVPTQVSGRNGTLLRTRSQRIPAKVNVIPAEGVESKDDLARSWAPRRQLRTKSEKSLQDRCFRARNRRDQERSKTDLMRRKRHLLQIAEKSIQCFGYVRFRCVASRFHRCAAWPVATALGGGSVAHTDVRAEAKAGCAAVTLRASWSRFSELAASIFRVGRRPSIQRSAVMQRFARFSPTAAGF
jgi:hypothetical protein